MKLKTLIHTLVSCHVRRFLRALSAAKSKTISIVVHTIRETQTMHLIIHPLTKNKNKNKNKATKSIFFGSFRLHYNFCSSKYSHVLPVPAPVYDHLPPATASGVQFYCDSTRNSVKPTGQQCCVHDQDHDNIIDSQLSGYLQWLEEKKVHGKSGGCDAGDQHDLDQTAGDAANHDDIDKLADLFIANCHAKFILEKQESARRFKEMLERSA
ncbi:cotton fiber protein [Parasponia andersonii]|uniref:Cotton fiber protein n=1 Tax=Parasponia andersonii TaxID=3476 RepID=A0A2P5BTV0_PARAD|nr:cotton fiber protein [Parasponia andersonii]